MNKINSLATLWAKGHNPQIRDHEVKQAVKTLGMLDTGVKMDADEINALEGEIMQIIKGKMNEEERKQFAEQVV